MTILLQGAGIQAVVSAPAGDPIGDTLRAAAVAYWTMNEASGTRIDVTLRGNNAIPIAPIGSVAGHIAGNAAHFASADSAYLRVPSSADVKMSSTDFHIALWVRLLSKAHYYAIIAKILLSDGTIEYGAYYESLDEFGFVVDGGDTVLADSLGSPDLNVWYFLEMQWDSANSDPRIAVNNAVFDDYGPSASMITNDDDLTIGGYHPAVGFDFSLDCDIQHVGMWKRFLTQPERDYLYNSGAGRALFP